MQKSSAYLVCLWVGKTYNKTRFQELFTFRIFLDLDFREPYKFLILSRLSFTGALFALLFASPVTILF